MTYTTGAAQPSRTVVMAGFDAPTRATATSTMAKMAKDVRASLPAPIVWENARKITAAVPQRDELAQALAIRQWVQTRFHFWRDPVDTQLLTVPEYMLNWWQHHGYLPGDCADAAELTAALCMAIGMPCSLVAVAFNSPLAPFSHVFTIATARTPKGIAKVEMDVTRPAGVARARFSRFRRLDI